MRYINIQQKSSELGTKIIDLGRMNLFPTSVSDGPTHRFVRVFGLEGVYIYEFVL
jgi:hypothetical protein